MALRPARLKFVFGVVFVFSGVYYYNYFHTSPSSDLLIFYDSAQEDLKSDVSTCNLLKLNPWDPNLMRLLEPPDDIPCKNYDENDAFVKLSDGCIFTVNVGSTEARKLFGDEKIFNCFYSIFDSSKNDFDQEILFFSSRNSHSNSSKIDADFLKVHCSIFGNPRKIVYENYFLCATLKNKRSFDKYDPSRPDRISVHVIILESTSASAVRRHMNATLDFLTHSLKGGHIFDGYTKVGHNSDPNFYALFANKRIYYEQEDMPADLALPIRSIDDLPFVWKYFAARNYCTSFQADEVDYDPFRKILDGFRRKSFDFSYRPFWKAAVGSSYAYCIRGRVTVDLQLEAARRLNLLLKDSLQFNVLYPISLSHGNPSNLEIVQQYLLPYLRTLHERGTLDHSALFVLGDHGSIYSKIRQSLSGVMEERMPFLYIRLPPSFIEAYPELNTNLKMNTDRLLSPFDIYQTLMDLNDVSKAEKSGQRPEHVRGMSLFFPIPANRTCNNADIPDHFCTCYTSKPVDVNNGHVLTAAGALLEVVNRRLQKYTNCKKLTLNKVIRSERVLLNDMAAANVKNGIEHKQFSSGRAGGAERLFRLRVAVECKENGALLEGELTSYGGAWNAAGQISRLNAYGNQSYCIEEKVLKPLCICY